MKPLCIIFDKFWGNGEVPGSWMCANVDSLFKWENPPNCKPSSLSSISGKILEQVIKQTLKVNWCLWEICKNKSSLINLISFVYWINSLIIGRYRQRDILIGSGTGEDDSRLLTVYSPTYVISLQKKQIQLVADLQKYNFQIKKINCATFSDPPQV